MSGSSVVCGMLRLNRSVVRYEKRKIHDIYRSGRAREAQSRTRVGMDRCGGDGWSILSRPEHQRPSTEASMVAGTVVPYPVPK